MCKYKILYHSNKGYIGECPNCQQIQLAYGTSALNFDPAQYHNFYKLLLEKQKEVKNEQNKNRKLITLSTEYAGFSLVLSVSELNELVQMLSQANFENEVQLLISSINK